MLMLQLWVALDCVSDIVQEQCYDNIRISKNAWDTNLIKVAHRRPFED